MTSLITHIISDLHLSKERADLLAIFKHYMQNIAIKSEQLFVLGDLFEVWIGDDCLVENNQENSFYLDVIALFQQYSSHGGKLYFIHGNRDFLLSKEFEKQTGGILLQEPFFTTLLQKNVALMHGDSLCTDDVAYQEFRTMVRNPQWQKEFLTLPILNRIEIAKGLRQQSKDAQTKKSDEIMDVNQQSVKEFFKQYDIDYLIHGHTHRQASHKINLENKVVKRIVLSDWGDCGFYLSLDHNSLKEVFFEITN